ncbi:PREDICTED: 5'-nucleotidase domain-containing protein 1 [Ceratosolen solmsi marchali]|uniref:5'-nucleotidase domain-containing protein 1 n=1 Tax=Ceratosolen solmsi marchali TaxID=326594 RepID=A0AAJ7DUD6_9HYME|nr:PREDICTED: 5'-nucleotidase domain-containing protein 1 [Ceratosolen solmsi marchali]
MKTFILNNYDCIGFDLDSTILQYNIKNLIQLEYKLIIDFLINKRGYNPKYFNESLTDKDWDFMQNGLFFDFEKGNILKLSSKGKVHSASHGTKFLNDEEIEQYYSNRLWDLSKIFIENPLVTRNGPLSLKIRTLLTCFDMPISIIFAKAVDLLDEENGKPLDKYNILPDLLDAILDMYEREQLRNNAGNFYSELKRNPEKYIKKCSPEVLAWIQELKKTKKIFLVTGSNFDFVEFTTSYAFCENLQSLFDIIVCYAKKPGFFTENRPFYSLKNNYEDKILSSEELEVGGIYNQGNFKDLHKFLARISNISNPKCLYIGDNLIEDIYSPNVSGSCNTLAIISEQLSEGMLGYDIPQDYEQVCNSKVWGSFFILKNSSGHEHSYWNHMIKKYSKICIPELKMIINISLDEPLKCFCNEDDDKELNGYYPAKPISIFNL